MLETRIRVTFTHNGKEIEGDLIKVASVSDNRVGLVGVISVEGENLMIRKLTELREVRQKDRVEDTWRDLSEDEPDLGDFNEQYLCDPTKGDPMRGLELPLPRLRPDLVIVDDPLKDHDPKKDTLINQCRPLKKSDLYERPASANHHGQRACEAYQASDQMVCDLCDLVWDVNDPDPPHCQRLTRIDPIMA